MAGGPFGMGFAVTVDGSTSGVSGANVVAGEGGRDDAKSGNTIGKFEMLNCGTTGPLGIEYFSTGGGTFVTVAGGLLRRTFGLVVGGAFNRELFLAVVPAGSELGAAKELAEAPVLGISSSSSINRLGLSDRS